MVDNFKVGKRISDMRKEKGITAEKLSEILNVTPQAVSKWENGKSLPDISTLVEISKYFEVSIDSILIPNQLYVIRAELTDGYNTYAVTPQINRFIEGNELRTQLTPQLLGIDILDGHIYLLILKYKTANGIAYDYFKVGDYVKISFFDKNKYSLEQNPMSIIGALYGNSLQNRDVTHKILHYKYFNRKEINVNSETFPCANDSYTKEYLCVIYLNSQGLNVVACGEDESLKYNKSGDNLINENILINILPGIRPLYYDDNRDCTWAGAMQAALEFMGEEYTYEDIMGMSGACYRFCFCDIWDYSAVDALIGFDFNHYLFEAIGYVGKCSDRIPKLLRSNENKKIRASIDEGKPIVAINLKTAAEWGVICGYEKKGKTLYCRSYFDGDKDGTFAEYAKVESFPFILIYFKEKIKKTIPQKNLISSLTVIELAHNAKSRDNYFQGRQGFEKWIEALKDKRIWGEEEKKENIERRYAVNDYMLKNLIDARRSAYVYLEKNLIYFPMHKDKLCEVIKIYKEITKSLIVFTSSIEDMNYCERLSEQAELITDILNKEKNIVKIIRSIL